MPFTDPTSSLPADGVESGTLTGDYVLTGTLTIPGNYGSHLELDASGVRMYTDDTHDQIAGLSADTNGSHLVSNQIWTGNEGDGFRLEGPDSAYQNGALTFPRINELNKSKRGRIFDSGGSSTSVINVHTEIMDGSRGELSLWDNGYLTVGTDTGGDTYQFNPSGVLSVDSWQPLYALGAGWVDENPTDVNRSAAVRRLPDGSYQLRGRIKKTTGAWTPGELICEIPQSPGATRGWTAFGANSGGGGFVGGEMEANGRFRVYSWNSSQTAGFGGTNSSVYIDMRVMGTN